ncbi:FAD-binding oxidoreductase [Sphingomonas cavernae]|uniref:FAD-binding oxidoreductase n=1 Tax=Sphingomonas cavernae TaxID=2320861 RepID=A0A418WRD5_9SPHN|nr:FAD-binding oxidoreductase [Sphingomonas cavernae]RJF93805.1 FAD-binding oxidoreductase [Sphingomonas cavernae]
MSHRDVIEALVAALGADAVRTDDAALALASHDIHVTGERPAAIVCPRDAAGVASAVSVATALGYAVIPRGGGLSYTGGYASPTPRAIAIDMRGLDRILDIAEEDMTITVQAGVTWKQINDALKPKGLRLPFIGTFSGAGATVGGGLGQGALFFGSARYGSAAEIVLGLEVALADGSLLRTGQGALAVPSKPILRGFGPDLTGLFTHDGGMFGIKTEASLRLIRMPAEQGYASFAFATLEAAADALCEIARVDLAEEVYILDPSAAGAVHADATTIAKTAVSVAREAGGALKAVKALAALAKGGTDFIPEGYYSLHLTAAGRCAAAVEADLDEVHRIAARWGGSAVAPTIPRVARAELFANLNGVLGPTGGRWAALNGKVAHSEARRLIAAFDAMIAPHAEEMGAHGVTCTRLVSALANHCFSFEPVFHWQDSWHPLHRAAPEPAHLAVLEEPAPNLPARALVDRLRDETVALFRSLGAASNQIGRTYPFRAALSPAPEALLATIKQALDPRGLMNPGVLGFA